MLAKAIITGRRKITKSTNTHSLNLSTDIAKANSNPDQQRENLTKTPERKIQKTFGKLQGKQQESVEFFQAYGKPPQQQRKQQQRPNERPEETKELTKRNQGNKGGVGQHYYLACGPRLELGKSGNTSKWMTTMIMMMTMMMMIMKSSSSPRFTTTTTPHNITPSPVLKAWHTAPKEKKQKTEPEEAKTKKRSTKQVPEQKKLRKKRKIKREGGETKQDERETERREEVTRDEQLDAREDTITNPWSRHKRGDMALFSLSSLLFSSSSLLPSCKRRRR